MPGYVYGGSLERNQLLPTAVGALRPSALVPETMANGEASGLGRVCIVGTPALRDFHPSLCAANLERAGIEARAVSLELKLERADMNTLGLARHFDDEQWRRQFCAELSLTLRAEEAVGLPAMLGLRDPHEVLADVEHRLGRRVFEIPTLPPSVPGMRLYEILRSALRAAGGRLVMGAEVTSSEREGDKIVSVSTHAAGRDLIYVAPWIVLASGGFASGGIALDSHWETHDSVLGLPLRGVPAQGQPRFVGTYLDEQPLARVGVAVDSDLRAEGAENVLVAGAALPGAVPWREGSGEGIALASGYRAAQVVGGRVSPTAATV
jgi:glycerol-3-phosphate dehydrogenase subunit B